MNISLDKQVDKMSMGVTSDNYRILMQPNYSTECHCGRTDTTASYSDTQCKSWPGRLNQCCLNSMEYIALVEITARLSEEKNMVMKHTVVKYLTIQQQHSLQYIQKIITLSG